MKDVEHGNPRSAGRFVGPIGVRVSSVAPAERHARPARPWAGGGDARSVS